MALFGGLFGHDQKSARATGAYTDTPQPPAAPPVQMDGYAPPPMPPQPLAQPPGEGLVSQQLPAAPPVKKTGAFDDDHYRQTMLAMAAGFFGSQNFGDGLGKAAEAIYNGNADAHKANKPTIGGPDDAFEVYTDPKTGEHSYKPIKSAVDYLHEKQNKVTWKDRADLNGRYAMGLAALDPEKRAIAIQTMSEHPDQFPGFDPAMLGSLPEPALGVVAGAGQTVAQAQAGERATQAETHRETYRRGQEADRTTRTGIMATKADASIADSHARVGLAQQAGARAAQASGRAAQANTRANLKAGIVGGYQYKMVNGKMMKRKVM